MAQENPFDVDGVARTAKAMIEKSAAVAKEESAKIDKEPADYGLGEAIVGATKLLNIGIAGATDIGRIAAETTPPDTVLTMGEYLASVVRRMVSQAGTVAAAAAIDVDGKKYNSKKWVESMTRLADIGILGSLEIIETVAAGPARFESQPARFDGFTADEQDAAEQDRVRTLRFAKTDDLPKRNATDDPIPAHRLQFDPPTLVWPNRTFAVIVETAGLVSGVYEGTVTVEHEDDGTAASSSVAVTVTV